MRAMMLAAGLGTRMRELTQRTPKPLLRVGDHYLIEYALQQLQRAGIHEVVINLHYHAEQIKNAIGDGKRYGLHIAYSEETERLETGGGIVKALPWLGREPFLVLSSDVVTDYPLAQLPKTLTGLAHLVMVPNPSFHPRGDFGLTQGKVELQAATTYTFGNIGVYHPDLFIGCEATHFPLSRVLLPAIERQAVSGELYQGRWLNIGTPEQLQEAAVAI